MTDDDEVLVALAAVGALEGDEQVAFEARLAGEPELAAAYDEALESAGLLAEAVSEPPPPHLRAAVLASIAASVPDTAEPTNVVDLGARRSHRRRWMLPATAAAAAVLVIGGALIITHHADAPGDPVAAVLDDDSAQHVALLGDLSGLTVIRSENEDASAIVGDGIEAGLTGDDVLQLWAIRDGVPTSMGTFTPDADGHVAAVMQGLLEPPDTIYAVTIEPAGGSPQPTSDPIAASS